MAFDATRANSTYVYSDDNDTDSGDERGAPPRRRKGNRERRQAVDRRETRHEAGRRPAPPRRGPTRAAREGRESFKCRHCRAFIGPTIGGGRHRNHCPICLHSRHVDGRRPGDRAGDCGAVMAPVARFDRPGGEPVLVHRCLGCGLERHNRLAADDNLALLTRLPLVAPRLSGRKGGEGEEARREVS